MGRNDDVEDVDRRSEVVIVIHIVPNESDRGSSLFSPMRRSDFEKDPPLIPFSQWFHKAEDDKIVPRESDHKFFDGTMRVRSRRNESG